MAHTFRLCVLLSLAVSQGWAAASQSSDETCLVQHKVLGSHSIKPIQMLKALADQFEPPIAGINDFLDRLSLDKLVSFGTDLLRMAKNETVMDMLHQNMEEMTIMLRDYADDLRDSARAMQEALKRPTDEKASLTLLKDFMLGQSKDIARIGAYVLVTVRDVIWNLPDGPLRNGSMPLVELLRPFTKRSLSDYIYGDLLEDNIDHMFQHQSRFCNMFMPVASNFSYFDKLMNEQGEGLFEQAKSMLTPLMPLIEGLDGDAAPAISRFLMSTLESAEGVVKVLGISFHEAVVAMSHCAKDHVHCKLARPFPIAMESAAASRTRWLAAAAVGAAAWAAVAA